MELIDYTVDPMSGLKTLVHVDNELKMHVSYEQDLESSIEMTRAMRNDDDLWRKGVKAGFVHVAHIPNVVISELLKIGINVYRDPLKEIVWGLRKLNKDHLITTTKNVC